MADVVVSIDTSGMERRLAAKPRHVRAAARRALPKIANQGIRSMRQIMMSRFRNPKGPLAASVRSVVAGDELRVGPQLPYAAFVNDGTRPHAINPKRPGGALAFVVGGQRIVLRAAPGRRTRADGRPVVMHPGFAGHHFIEATADELPPLATELLRRALVAEVRRDE